MEDRSGSNSVVPVMSAARRLFHRKRTSTLSLGAAFQPCPLSGKPDVETKSVQPILGDY